jgi:hypothetical protein
MTNLNQAFIEAYMKVRPNKTVYSDNFPEEMKASEEDEEGWIEWKPLTGTISESAYHEIEKSYNVLFPVSFVNWHKAFFFLDGDCCRDQEEPSLVYRWKAYSRENLPVW